MTNAGVAGETLVEGAVRFREVVADTRPEVVLLPEVAAVIGIDGLHPTEAGYRRIAEIFFAAIQANLEVK